MLADFVKYILTPSNLITIGLLISLIFMFFNHHKKSARILFISSCLLYFILGCGPVSFWLMRGLEYQYAAVDEQALNNDIENIIVLAGYAETQTNTPITGWINSASAYRILEATRIFQHNPDIRNIWISGSGQVPQIMKSVFMAIGVPEGRIMIDDQSIDTLDSARNLSALLSSRRVARVYLVTSAGHMPRAVNAFKNNNILPIPAPTQYLSKQNILAQAYLPTPDHFRISDMAILEYLAAVRDKIVAP